MVSQAGFLVVDDEAYVAHRIADGIRPFRDVQFAETLADARRMIDSMEFCAAIVDLRLPDGSGLDLLADLRSRFPDVPVLVISAVLDRDVINQVHALGAEYVCKPWSNENLASFVQRALGAQDGVTRSICNRMLDLVRRCRLSKRETQILRLAVAGTSRGDVREELGVTENTLKTEVRRLLAKTGHTSLAALALDVLGSNPDPTD